MKAEFVELPAFERTRASYLDEGGFQALQTLLMARPEAGAVIEGSGGLRKIRFADPRRGKGKRGGIRVIYYFWTGGPQFWLFAIYDKDEVSDLTNAQLKLLRSALKSELDARRRA